MRSKSLSVLSSKATIVVGVGNAAPVLTMAMESALTCAKPLNWPHRTDNTYHVTFVHAVVVVGARRSECPEPNVSVVNGEGYVASAGRLRIHT